MYLSKIREAEPLPAWYFAVGTTVHRYIEGALKDYLDYSDSLESTVEQLFYSEVERLMKIEPDTSLWLHGGSKDDPVVEDKALKLAQVCAERAMIFLDDVYVWEIEYDASGFLPGCEMEIKAFIDLIGEHKKHGPIIGDWKTGKSKPKNNDQLETYDSLLMMTPDAPFMEHGSTRFTGLWIMLNPGAPQARPVTFKETPESLGAKYAELQRKIESGAFPATPSFGCNFCEMKLNCKLQSGATPRTLYYDRVEEDGGVPF